VQSGIRAGEMKLKRHQSRQGGTGCTTDRKKHSQHSALPPPRQQRGALIDKFYIDPVEIVVVGDVTAADSASACMVYSIQCMADANMLTEGVCIPVRLKVQR